MGESLSAFPLPHHRAYTDIANASRYPTDQNVMIDSIVKLSQIEIKDPDVQVRSSIELVFDYFRQCCTAYGVRRRFGWEKLVFSKRSYGGTWAGKRHLGTAHRCTLHCHS